MRLHFIYWMVYWNQWPVMKSLFSHTSELLWQSSYFSFIRNVTRQTEFHRNHGGFSRRNELVETPIMRTITALTAACKMSFHGRESLLSIAQPPANKLSFFYPTSKFATSYFFKSSCLFYSKRTANLFSEQSQRHGVADIQPQKTKVVLI